MEINTICTYNECTSTNNEDTVICENCRNAYHVKCLGFMGQEPEDVSHFEGFETYTEIHFCSITCMIDFCLKIKKRNKYYELKEEKQ